LDHLEMTLAAHGANAESARNDLLLTLRELTELYPGHIWKEEYLLLPMADKLLSIDEQASLKREFEHAESNIGVDVHHAFESMIARVYRHRNKTRKVEAELPAIQERMANRR
jgi:hemerythrin-like domain-containing protein